MTPDLHTPILIIAIVVAFAAGVYVERGNRVPMSPSQIPLNLDVAAALTDAKNARAEAQNYQALLTRTIDTCHKTGETH